MSSQTTSFELVLASDSLTEGDVRDIVESMGQETVLALCDGRSATERHQLTDDQQEQLRREASVEIREIVALHGQWVEFRQKGKIEKITLAELYAMVLVGDERIRNLDYAIKTLVAMLRDARIPQKHKGLLNDPEPRAIRLAIAAALAAKEREFRRNLALVPKMMQDFYGARDRGFVQGMEQVLNKLAAAHFKGPVAKHFQCKMSDLRHFFDRLQREVDAVKGASQRK